MEIRILSPAATEACDDWLSAHAQANVWQSSPWGSFKENQGQEVRVYGADGCGAVAQVFIDRTTFGLSTWDVPRGPLWIPGHEDSLSSLLEAIFRDAKQEGCLQLTLSPAMPLPGSIVSELQLKPSGRFEQPEATVMVDLTQSEDQILEQMHQKGRYNIRLAQKHGITVSESQDIDAFYALLEQTAKRDGYTIKSKKHYAAFLSEVRGAFLLLAYPPEDRGQRTEDGNSCPSSFVLRPLAIAGLLGVIYGPTGIYYYGASDYEHRELMAPYLLQWEAMKRCKAAGCTEYDLLGVAPQDAPPSHPWAGITAFKAKFGGKVLSYPPELAATLRPGVLGLLKLKRKLIG